MHTLCLRYTLDPNRIDAFRTYVEDETPVIRDCGGRVVGYYLPTDFAGPTNIAYGLIEFASLDRYERYRETLAADPTHRRNAAALTESGVLIAIERSIIRRHGYAEGSAATREEAAHAAP
ncbi:NIPSNAP family protein [Methylobacterium sp. J-068]|uniref:NIPSNAP family protein n=1 Tax=Methylobacterium sp. J-068 TaxID=2836649 RepID=UPI001FBB8002|nr:NIPSNAP family protein [Methylobacterium sp. J-068]MCJ2033823.1 NIPSNAP family protein [Methylobacterium sp. J-068]